MSDSPIQPPADYSINMARDRLDDALMIMVTECELSGKEIYKEITDRIRDTLKYFEKPRDQLRDLLDLVEGGLPKDDIVIIPQSDGSWNQFFQYDDILKCSDLFNESNYSTSDIISFTLNTDKEDVSSVEVYNLSDRSIKADSYQAIVRIFEESFTRDIRPYSFEAELLSNDGMDLLAAELIELWNDYIVPSIVSKVNDDLSAEDQVFNKVDSSGCYLSIGITDPHPYERRAVPRGNRYDVYFDHNHIPTFHKPEDCAHIRTLFDLIHAYEQALEDHREYVNLIERCDY